MKPAPPPVENDRADQVRRDLLREHGDTPETRALAETAAQLWARAAQAQARVDAEGLTVDTPRGPCVHPCVGIERTCRLGFLTAVRALRQRPKRLKVGRPMMGEMLDSRFYRPQNPAERKRARVAARYLNAPPA